jgi:hypothetical protein
MTLHREPKIVIVAHSVQAAANFVMQHAGTSLVPHLLPILLNGVDLKTHIVDGREGYEKAMREAPPGTPMISVDNVTWDGLTNKEVGQFLERFGLPLPFDEACRRAALLYNADTKIDEAKAYVTRSEAEAHARNIEDIFGPKGVDDIFGPLVFGDAWEEIGPIMSQTWDRAKRDGATFHPAPGVMYKQETQFSPQPSGRRFFVMREEPSVEEGREDADEANAEARNEHVRARDAEARLAAYKAHQRTLLKTIKEGVRVAERKRIADGLRSIGYQALHSKDSDATDGYLAAQLFIAASDVENGKVTAIGRATRGTRAGA